MYAVLGEEQDQGDTDLRRRPGATPAVRGGALADREVGGPQKFSVRVGQRGLLFVYLRQRARRKPGLLR